MNHLRASSYDEQLAKQRSLIFASMQRVEPFSPAHKELFSSLRDQVRLSLFAFVGFFKLFDAPETCMFDKKQEMCVD